MRQKEKPEKKVNNLGKPLFEMCCAFYPTLPGCERACQDGLGHFFSTIARLTEGGESKAI